MNKTLKTIKRLIIQGNYQFTLKAEYELEADGLIIEDVFESILNATDIYKVLTSKNPRTHKDEKLYIILSFTYDNVLIYTKGKIIRENKFMSFYVLISSKRSI